MGGPSRGTLTGVRPQSLCAYDMTLTWHSPGPSTTANKLWGQGPRVGAVQRVGPVPSSSIPQAPHS